jgi:glycerol-3-phosphate dehydrogenase
VAEGVLNFLGGKLVEYRRLSHEVAMAAEVQTQAIGGDEESVALARCAGAVKS